MIDLEESMEIGGRDTESRRFPMIRVSLYIYIYIYIYWVLDSKPKNSTSIKNFLLISDVWTAHETWKGGKWGRYINIYILVAIYITIVYIGDDDFGDSSSEDDDATQIRVHQIPPEWDDIDEDSETGSTYIYMLNP